MTARNIIGLIVLMCFNTIGLVLILVGALRLVRALQANDNKPPPSVWEKKRDPWWVWHWDRTVMVAVDVPYKTIWRWRRGSLLTVYKFVGEDDSVFWYFFGPFNLAIAFGKS